MEQPATEKKNPLPVFVESSLPEQQVQGFTALTQLRILMPMNLPQIMD